MTQTYKVQVSMNQAHIVESGFVWKQGDFGFNIEIEVLDFDTTGATPQIIFRKSTGAVEATQISVAGNKFTYAIRGTELDTPGPCVCDLKLKDSTTKRVSTASFKYFVIPDTMDGLNQQASSYSDTIAQIISGYEDDVDDVKNDIFTYTSSTNSTDGKNKVTKYVNGSWEAGASATPKLTNNTNRIRPFDFIRVKQGQVISIQNGSYHHAVGIWTGEIGSAIVVRNDQSFITNNENITINSDGFFIVTFALASDHSATVNPDNFDGEIKISTAISTLITNMNDCQRDISVIKNTSVNKNLIGNEMNELYPVFIPAGTTLTMSTSDGSNISVSDLHLNLYDSTGARIDYFGFNSGTSERTITTNSQRGTTFFVSWNKLPNVPCQLEIGSQKTAYQAYSANVVTLDSKYQKVNDAILHGYTEIKPLVNGSFSTNGLYFDAPTRLRTDLIPVRAGHKLMINNGSLKHAVAIWRGTVATANIIRNDGSFSSSNENIIFEYDGFCVVVFAKQDASQSISSLDFDGSVTSYNYLDYDGVPEYWKATLTSKIDTIQSESGESAAGDSFIFITDYHMKNNANNSPDLIKAIMKNTDIRFVVNGGDVITQESSQENALKRLAMFNQLFKGVNILNVVGNHDQNNPGESEQTYQLTNAQSYSMLCKKQEGSYFSTDGFDYAFDNVSQKIRYFVIGSWHQSWIVTSQVLWFCNQLLNVPDGYNIVVISHLGLSPSGVNGNFQYILNAMEAYQNRQPDFHYSTSEFDYSGATANIIGAITGHVHRDLDYMSEMGFPVIGTTTDAINESHPGTTMNYGTVTEQAFDVVRIDLTNKKIKLTRIGAGSDREFSYTT